MAYITDMRFPSAGVGCFGARFGTSFQIFQKRGGHAAARARRSVAIGQVDNWLACNYDIYQREALKRAFEEDGKDGKDGDDGNDGNDGKPFGDESFFPAVSQYFFNWQ